MLFNQQSLAVGILLLLGGPLPIHGQAIGGNQPYQIVMEGRGSNTGRSFRIDALRGSNFVQLRFSRLDSTRYQLLAVNPAYVAARQAVDDAMEAKLPLAERKQGVHQAVQRMLALEEPYRVYRRDSLRLDTRSNPALVQLLDSVYRASPETLERKSANSSHIILDGTLVAVRVLAAGKTEKDLVVHSPNFDSHPLLYRLLHETLLLYRTARPNTFFDKHVTAGY